MTDLLERWRAAARADEAPILIERATAALGEAPGPGPLRALAVAAGVLELDATSREQVLGLVRWGLGADDPAAVWDAVHLAADLRLTEVAAEVDRLLDPAAAEAPVRARAIEAFAVLGGDAAPERVEAIRTQDPDWSVRRLATEAQRRLRNRLPPEGGLFSRFKALLRTGRASLEDPALRLDAGALARFGLRLPPAYKLFLVEACSGGRVELVAEEGSLGAGRSFTIASIDQLARRVREALPADDLKRFNEYVWERYVEGARTYPKVDEDEALRRYGARYDGGQVDADAWSYGVLLFEAAFRDEARRDHHLRLAREVLEAWRELTGEAWEVVDDRLAEIEDTARDEGLARPVGAAAPLAFGVWGGVHELFLDLARPGVWARDPDEDAPWELAPSLLAWFEDPHARRPGAAARAAAGGRGALALLDEAEAHLERQEWKQAGRLFGDALELDHRTADVLGRAAALLQRPELSPLLAAQLLSTIPIAGDKTSLAVVRAALLALPPERALALVEAVVPYNEAGSDVALFVDAAAGLRRKSHEEVRAMARRLKQERGQAHIRTIRNPFYKK